MSKEPNGPVYGGLTGLRLPAEPVDLGHGVMLTSTYAHIFCPYVMAFARPDHPGAHHPGPWKTPGFSTAFDITAQLAIPESVGKSSAERARAALIIVFAMRMWCDPAIALPVASTVPFSELPATPDADAQISTLEISERRFRLGLRNPDHDPLEGLHDVATHWMTAFSLYEQSSEFQLATDALTTGQFVGNSALLMVSLWGALEAIFSPSTSELKFRVSSLIASYLYPPGAAPRGEAGRDCQAVRQAVSRRARAPKALTCRCCRLSAPVEI